MVSTASIMAMAFSLLVGIAIPVALILVILKKFRLRLRPFWIGCAVWLLFAIVLEQIMHKLVLATPTGAAIKANLWWMALYGGLAAGLFEESGRYLAMRFTLKKEHKNDLNALVYGAGHGGVEAAYLLILGMVNYIVYSVMINNGTTGILTAPLDATQAAAMQKVFDTIVSTPALKILASPVERIIAVTLHTALSVIVWFAVTRRKLWLYPLAILIHAAVDASAVILSRTGVSVWWIELAVAAMTAAVAAAAYVLWKRFRNQAQTTEIESI